MARDATPQTRFPSLSFKPVIASRAPVRNSMSSVLDKLPVVVSHTKIYHDFAARLVSVIRRYVVGVDVLIARFTSEVESTRASASCCGTYNSTVCWAGFMGHCRYPETRGRSVAVIPCLETRNLAKYRHYRRVHTRGNLSRLRLTPRKPHV